jgi:hypothetical protein
MRQQTMLCGLLFAIATTAGACGGIEPAGSEELGQAGQKSSYLFGLSADEIRELGARYNQRVSAKTLLRQLEAPFACERFGQLCEAVGATQAQSLVELQWTLMRQGVDKQQLLQQLERAVDQRRLQLVAAKGEDRHAVEPAAQAPAKIGVKQQATSGRLHCSIGSTRETSNSTDKIKTSALTSDFGTIAITTITTEHYSKVLWFWFKLNAASLCVRNPSMTRWIAATGSHSSYDGSDYCRTNVSEVSKSLGMWASTGDRVRGDGCGDFNSHTLYKCACDMVAMN